MPHGEAASGVDLGLPPGAELLVLQGPNQVPELETGGKLVRVFHPASGKTGELYWTDVAKGARVIGQLEGKTAAAVAQLSARVPAVENPKTGSRRTIEVGGEYWMPKLGQRAVVKAKTPVPSGAFDMITLQTANGFLVTVRGPDAAKELKPLASE